MKEMPGLVKKVSGAFISSMFEILESSPTLSFDGESFYDSLLKRVSEKAGIDTSLAKKIHHSFYWALISSSEGFPIRYSTPIRTGIPTIYYLERCYSFEEIYGFYHKFLRNYGAKISARLNLLDS
jgi:hypothetical protein